MKPIRLLCLAGTLTLPTLAPAGSDYPTIGIVYAKDQASSISYSCRKEGEKLQCEMTQLLVSQKLKPSEVADRRKKLREMYIKTEGSEKAKEECVSLTNEFKRLDSDLKKKPGVLSEKRRKELEELSPKAKIEITKLARYWGDYCANPGATSRNAVIDYQIDNELRTCTTLVNHWTETFVRPAGVEAGNTGSTNTWVTKGEPSGPCGVVLLNRWEIGDDTSAKELGFYNYVARKVVTNPGGQSFAGTSCAILDESKFIYTWQSRDVPFDCKNLKLSPF